MTAPTADIPYDCAQQGHVWLEASGLPFARYRDRERGLVAVECEYCIATADLEGHGANTAPPQTDLVPRLTFRQKHAPLANDGPVILSAT